MNITFCYNVKHSEPSTELAKQEDLEFDSPMVIETIAQALRDLGHKVEMVEADLDAFDKLRDLAGKTDLVFNIAEGLKGDARESQIPLYCELLGLPYTHSSPTTHALTLNKRLCNLALSASGIKTPKGVLVSKLEDLQQDFDFPVIVKPNAEGSSKGVFDKNVVAKKEDLKDVVEHISENYDKPVLIEEFIDGREFTVSLLGNGQSVEVLPIVEQKFDFLPEGFNKIASFELKWLYEDKLSDLKDAYDCPAILTDELKKEIEEVSKKVYRILEVKDCARIDYRLSNDGKLYFIEINTLPGINPDESVISYFPLASRTGGMKFGDLIGRIVQEATERYELKV